MKKQDEAIEMAEFVYAGGIRTIAHAKPLSQYEEDKRQAAVQSHRILPSLSPSAQKTSLSLGCEA